MARRDRAFLRQHASRFVTDLPRRAGHPEQLVDADGGKEREAPQAPRELGGRQRFEPQLAAALGRHPLFGQRPRRRLEHIPVLHVPVRQHVLDVVGQAPHLLLAHDVDRRRGGDGSSSLMSCRSVSSTSRGRVLRSTLPRRTRLLARHVLEHRQYLLAERRSRGCCRGIPTRSSARASRRARASTAPRRCRRASRRASTA